MPKTPLNPSPLALRQHHFIRFDIRSNESNEFGSGVLEVNRTARPHPDDPLKWVVDLNISLAEDANGEKPPPYEGSLHIRGYFEIHPDYPNDPERLINITAASILYGAAREMLANFTARSSNGMISLPSVSFAEPVEKPEKKGAATKTKRKTGNSRT